MTIARLVASVAALAACAFAAACSASHLPTTAELADPGRVVRGYLDAAVADDCDGAAGYWVQPEPGYLRGDLCSLGVSSYEIDGADRDTSPSADQRVVAATLTTGGNCDLTVPAGQVLWFFQVLKQPDGSWQIAQGGSGP